MAHIHVIDRRFHICRATDTRTQRHERAPDLIERLADYGRHVARLNADLRPMIRLPTLSRI